MARLISARPLRRQAERRPWVQRLLERAEALIAWVFWEGSALLGPRRAAATGRALLRLLGPRMEKSRHLRRNFTLALPEKTPAEVEDLVRSAWGSLGAVMAEYPHLGTIAGSESYLEVVVEDEFRRRVKLGEQVVLVSAHLANWELTLAAAQRLGFDAMAVYTPLSNRYIDRRLAEYRSRAGFNLVARDEATRGLMRHLSKGGTVGLVVDQRVDGGEPVSFFGRDMWTSTTPARLALRFGCPLVPLRSERLGPARYRVTFYAPIEADRRAEDEGSRAVAMTRRVNQHFEEWIRARPGEWLCSKRRWPKSEYTRAEHQREED